MKLAVIPARGGSKRIPRKNIRPFAGRPMIGFAIQAALESKVFDHIVVSTDDEEIATIAESLGAEVPFTRSVELANDHTPTVPVVADAIVQCRDMGLKVDHVCCIYPGVPFIEPADLLAALAILEQGACHYVFPVAPFPSAVQRALRRTDDGRTQPFFPQFANTRTQDLEPGYYDAGQFYWGQAQSWLDGLTIHAHAKTTVLPEWRVVDIDTEEDWVRAERMYSAFARKGAA